MSEERVAWLKQKVEVLDKAYKLLDEVDKACDALDDKVWEFFRFVSEKLKEVNDLFREVGFEYTRLGVWAERLHHQTYTFRYAFEDISYHASQLKSFIAEDKPRFEKKLRELEEELKAKERKE